MPATARQKLHRPGSAAPPNRVKLTQRLAETMPPPADGHLVIWDANLPGFGLRISSKGRRSWIAMYRLAGGEQVMETIGTLAATPAISDARNRARASFEQARQGIHPVAARKRTAAPEAPYTLSVLIGDFIKRYHERRGSRPSTIYEARRLCRRALPYLGDKPVRGIKKADILVLINDLADTRINKWGGKAKGGSLSEAAGVLRHLRTCFHWAVDENLVDVDPTAGVRHPLGGRRERERVLSEAEIKGLWQVCDEIGYPYGPLIQLLLLTGQRLREVGKMPWHELDLPNRVWHLPSERAKNHHANDTHLSDFAMEIINKLPRFPGFVFSVSGGKLPVSCFSYYKPRIDQRLEEKLGTVEPWVVHDLRRTCATGMAKLGIAHNVLDRVLNHVDGVIKGTARIYNRFQYTDEREAALEAWSRQIEAWVYPDRAQSNVVAMV